MLTEPLEAVSFLGRLATYRYLDMDGVIAEALDFARAFLKSYAEKGAVAPVHTGGGRADSKSSCMSNDAAPKVLMISYACNPDGSGEHWLGWGWAEQAAKRYRVHLVTPPNAREAVTRESSGTASPRILWRCQGGCTP